MEQEWDGNISEVKIGLHKFKIKGSEVFCRLVDDQVSTMVVYLGRKQKIRH